jgi:O-antigen biosynthesis protein
MKSDADRLLSEREQLRALRSAYVHSRSAKLRALFAVGKSLLRGGSGDATVLPALVPDPMDAPQSRFAANLNDMQSRLNDLQDQLLTTLDLLEQERVIAPEEATPLVSAFTRRHLEPKSDIIVSVIIPVYNQWATTLRCLQACARWLPTTCDMELIIVDDASADETPRALSHLPGVLVVRNDRNIGFLRSCNRGAAVASGQYICFLNNDTEPQEKWLDYLVEAAENDETTGAVGAKLMYPDGSLQEAGGIIWRDATGWNYGRSDDPRKSEYCHRREVDYCSGAALMVRSDLFRRFGGFDEQFAPAYYEDVDLCFAVRNAGYKVIYEPHSRVVHYEGISSGRDLAAGTKRFQDINRPKFRRKWSRTLADHFAHNPASVSMAARRLAVGQRILVIDSYVPMHDRDAGSSRLFAILRVMRNAGYSVSFLPDNRTRIEPYATQLEDMGIEVLFDDEGLDAGPRLGELLRTIDIAWICRPYVYEKHAPAVRSQSKAKIVYDTIDLHFLRERREAELMGNPEDPLWKARRTMELGCAGDADVVVTVSDAEKLILEDFGIPKVALVPTIHELASEAARYPEKRRGVVFIGGYDHQPNVDAARWLVEEIMPLVWAELPGTTLTLLGSNPPLAVQALASDRVLVPGYIADVAPYFERSRVFAAALRFGAGMKGKIGQSLSYALPVVTTSIGTEGFDLRHGENCIVADSAADFARAIIQLHADDFCWRKLSEAAAEVLAPTGLLAADARVRYVLELLTN